MLTPRSRPRIRTGCGTCITHLQTLNRRRGLASERKTNPSHGPTHPQVTWHGSHSCAATGPPRRARPGSTSPKRATVAGAEGGNHTNEARHLGRPQRGKGRLPRSQPGKHQPTRPRGSPTRFALHEGDVGFIAWLGSSVFYTAGGPVQPQTAHQDDLPAQRRRQCRHVHRHRDGLEAYLSRPIGDLRDHRGGRRRWHRSAALAGGSCRRCSTGRTAPVCLVNGRHRLLRTRAQCARPSVASRSANVSTASRNA